MENTGPPAREAFPDFVRLKSLYLKYHFISCDYLDHRLEAIQYLKGEEME